MKTKKGEKILEMLYTFTVLSHTRLPFFSSFAGKSPVFSHTVDAHLPGFLTQVQTMNPFRPVIHWLYVAPRVLSKSISQAAIWEKSGNFLKQ